MDYKKRVTDALNNYYKKQEPSFKKKRKNAKPEKAVEQQILIWCRQKGFDVDVVESKSKFNTQTMRYTGRAASPGMSDIIGNTNNGLAVFIELKSKGRRVASALAPKQREFLIRKIHTGCFAIMCDSIEYAENTWNQFLSLPNAQRIEFLLNELPTPRDKQLNLNNQNPGIDDVDGDDNGDLPF